jgi:hypothetical protein
MNNATRINALLFLGYMTAMSLLASGYWAATNWLVTR